MLVRFCKTSLVAACAIDLLLVVVNNLSDYGTNFQFVQHVLSMDTTFESSQLHWRAIESPWIHHAFYVTIILWEAAALGLISVGTWTMARQWRAPADRFNEAKSLATLGLTLSLLLWFLAFIAIGGEWFAMWQSPAWNGLEAASRLFTINGIVLIFLHLPESSLTRTAAKNALPRRPRH